MLVPIPAEAAMRLFFDATDDARIDRASSNAMHAITETDQLRYQVRDLQRKVDGLTLTCQALWEFIRSRHDLDDDLLVCKIEEIDARDGKTDGRILRPLTACPTCRRKSKATRKSCLYCGTELPANS